MFSTHDEIVSNYTHKTWKDFLHYKLRYHPIAEAKFSKALFSDKRMSPEEYQNCVDDVGKENADLLAKARGRSIWYWLAVELLRWLRQWSRKDYDQSCLESYVSKVSDEEYETYFGGHNGYSAS